VAETSEIWAARHEVEVDGSGQGCCCLGVLGRELEERRGRLTDTPQGVQGSRVLANAPTSPTCLLRLFEPQNAAKGGIPSSARSLPRGPLSL